MFFRCAIVLVFFAALLRVQATDFATNIPPTVTYSESYVSTVQKDGFGGYQVGVSSKMAITAKCSMKGVDLTTIDGSTEIILDAGDFTFDDILWDADNYFDGDTSAVFTLTDEFGDTVGAVKVSWNQSYVIVGVTVTNDADDYEVEAAGIVDSAPIDPQPTTPYSDEPLVDLSFGDNILEPRTLYVNGTVAFSVDNRVTDTLSSIHLLGSIDSQPPGNLVVTDPASGSTIFESLYTIHGTATDGVSGLDTVTVQINGGAFQAAQLDTTSTWSLAGAVFKPGRNKIVVDASDVDGNLRVNKPIYITYSTKSTLSVEADGDHPGKVESNLFQPITFVPGTPSPVATSAAETGATLHVRAIPGPGALFGGWTSSAGSLPNASSANLAFTMTPNLTLTAHFVANPYLTLHGAYNGLIQAGSEDGFFSAAISRHGQFTGKIKIGRLGLQIHGAFDADGQFTGTFKKRGVTYTVTLQIGGTGEGGAGQITGSIDGSDASSASLTADVAGYFKKTHELEASDVGAYNVMLPPIPNGSPTFPVGIGFGRVTLSKVGAARFVGKLGDGTPVAAGSILSQAHVWPFYASLYKGLGSIGGPVTLDRSQPATDLTGNLAWARPTNPTSPPKPFPSGFSGQAQLIGAKWTPQAGPSTQRLFLNPSSGAGVVAFDAPAVAAGGLNALATDASATVTMSNTIMVAPSNPSPVQAVKLSLSVATGLFSGSFADQSDQVHHVSGIIVSTPGVLPKTDAAGGLFQWGDVTGSVQVTGTP